MRSLLFVPADSEKKLAKGIDSGADVLLVDLEDSVSIAQKPAARIIASQFLQNHNAYIRVNSLDSGLIDDDLKAVLVHKPLGIMLPKSQSGKDITHLHVKLNALEAMFGIAEGSTKILPVATETGQSIFGLESYKGSSPRLIGLTWGAEDLAADIGAQTNRGEDGRHTEPFRMARSLMLMAAASAEVLAIDTIYPSYKNEAGLRQECVEALRDGFVGKMAIHPAQVAIINEIFTPSQQAVERARKIVKAFSESPTLGVIGIDGEMVDKPHLKMAERLLKRIL